MSDLHIASTSLGGDDYPPRHPKKRVCDGSFRLISVEKYLRTGEYPKFTSSQEKQNFVRYTTKFQLFDDVLYYVGSKRLEKRQVVLTQEKLRDVLEECHSDQSSGGHHGLSKTQKKVAQLFYWKEITKDVKDWVMSCAQCQRPPKSKDLRDSHALIASEPWELVGVDLTGSFTRTLSGNSNVCLMSDLFSKWVVATPVPDKTPASVARALLKAVYVHGSPKRFLIDKNKKFIKELSNGVSEMFCVEYANAATYHCGGQEDTMEVIIPILTKYAEMGYQDNWDEYLPAITYGINVTVHPSTNCTPFYMMYGRHPRSPLNLTQDCSTGDELSQGVKGTPTEICSSYIEALTRVHDRTVKNIRKSQILQKKQIKNCREEEKGYRRLDNKTVIQASSTETSSRKCSASGISATGSCYPESQKTQLSHLEEDSIQERSVQVQSSPLLIEPRTSSQSVQRIDHPHWQQVQKWHSRLETSQTHQNCHEPFGETELHRTNQTFS